MAYDEKLAVRVRPLLKGIAGFREREMFGGLAFMYRDRMCFGIVGHDLVVRVAADEFEAVMRRERVRPMDFTGTPLKGFVYVSPPGLRSRPALRAWLERGRRFVSAASARTARRRPGLRRSLIPTPRSGR
jgi:TfoX N-terminal domain